MEQVAEDHYPTPASSARGVQTRRRAAVKATGIPRSSLKRRKTPRPISVPRRCRKMDSIKAVHKVTKPPKGSYNEELFDLSSYRGINPLPAKYEHTSPLTSNESDIEPRFWFPAPIEDNIKKRLFLHPSNQGIVWVGRHAEAKLQEEVKKYHRKYPPAFTWPTVSHVPDCVT
jgi:hypothetical protein